MPLSLIAAVGRHGEIGRDNDLVWRTREDQLHFKSTTMGHPVVMGRKTWESLPAKFRPLPGRRNIVVTHNGLWQGDGAERAGSLQEALSMAGDVTRVFIVGGAQVYEAALPMADELVLTEIDAVFERADAHFPRWDRAAFDEVSRTPHIDPEGRAYAFVTYRRKCPP